jgi:hypothetical protein
MHQGSGVGADPQIFTKDITVEKVEALVEKFLESLRLR